MKSRNLISPRAALAGVALACTVATAAAAPATLPQTISPGFNSVVWHLHNDQGDAGACAPAAAGFGFRDAGNTGTAPDLGNAYDGGFLLYVGGQRYADPDGIIDITGNVATADAMATTSGLNVSVQHLFQTGASAVRMLVTLANPTGADISTTVNVPTNIEQDANLNINATSSGDTTVSTADRWLVISESADVAVAPANEVTSFVFYGPGTPQEVPTAYNGTVWTCSGDQGIEAVFDVTIPAGQTRYLMFVGGIAGVATADNLPSSAISAMAAYDNNSTIPAEFLASLTATQRSQILNWSFPLPPPPPSDCTGLTGTKLTLCQKICEAPTTTTTAALIKFYRAAFRTDPPCLAD